MVTGKFFFMRLFRGLFYLHLLLIAVLVIFLTIRGFLSAGKDHRFHHLKWYAPLLSSIACGGAITLAWQSITRCNPSGAVRAAFWLSPLLTCGVGVLFVSIGFTGSLAAGVLVLVFSVIQSLYACWVNPRFEYATKVLSISMAPSPPSTGFVFLSVVSGTVYATFLVAGIGGATAIGTSIDTVFILVILLSLAWTMHVIRNILHVTMARIVFLKFMCGIEFDTQVALLDTIRYLVGSICIGSVLAPVLGVIRGSARAMNLVAGDTDEFMFSCANCYSGVASTLIMYGNRWGFVHVGVCNKGFVQASGETWEMFKRAGLEPVINYDLTGSFCFLSGVAVGATCTLVAGSWALVIHKSYATEVSIYAFLIGYLICRIAMAWPQACVSAYYVAYSEDPQSVRFDSTTIRDCIDRIQRYRA
ncbi:protein PNS1 [Vitis riparia]|uniref:protein PNS1 n=1 Tax=Vitis riparia TaxID=96939 RepID=UPI00155AD2D9|nr:protein PNS1 [Vitis riparia]XP_034692687.1 protein PNS1 [Vitis riparia]